jgi:phosphomannomutase/phosphoglucomutase
VEKVMRHFSSLSPRLDHTDGISAEFEAWRFNLRSSNTEPLLRRNIESRGDQALLIKRTAELSALIGAPDHSH